MVQQAVIVLLFLAASAYLGYVLYKSFAKSGCSSGCGSCGIDLSKIKKEPTQKSMK